MDFPFEPAVEAFRDEVRTFLRARLPGDIRARVERGEEMDRATQMRWHRVLLEQGWAAPGWPREHGGTGWDLARQFVFDQELAAAGAPRMIPFNMDMVGPMFIHLGTQEQQRRFLPRVLSGEDWWCQGFSEPGAGSDLAALSCKAVRDGDAYVVDGTKLWTTFAQYADWMFALVRTDSSGRKQQGITLVLIDMHAPGVSYRPLRTFDGGYEINQCFFDAVRVPLAQRIGEENQGWGHAKFLLGLERLGIAEVARSKAMLARLKRMAATPLAGAAPLMTDPDVAERLARMEIDLVALEVTERRFLFDPRSHDLGPEASILKLRGTVVQQAISQATVELLGHHACADLPAEVYDGANDELLPPSEAANTAAHYFNLRKISIYGGSNEIQRNIVAKSVLGL